MFNKSYLLAIIVVCLTTASCSKSAPASPVSNCDPNISYSAAIKPVMAAHCNTAGCHDDITITALDNYQTVHDGAAQIKASVAAGTMPKNGVLATADKSAILCWIDNGAKNN